MRSKSEVALRIIGSVIDNSKDVSDKVFDQISIKLFDEIGVYESLNIYRLMYDTKISEEDYVNQIKIDRYCLENDLY